MAKIKVRKHQKRRIYVHNDLSNGASYFKQRIEKRLANNDQEGIAFDFMALLILLAFVFEARTNFVGSKVMKKWKERASFHVKVKRILSNLEIDPDWNERPFSTVNSIKAVRDMLAHGKPQEIPINEEVVIDQSEADQAPLLKSEWQKYCTIDFIRVAYEDTEAIWKLLLDRAGIRLFETLTSSFGSITVVEKLDSDKT